MKKYLGVALTIILVITFAIPVNAQKVVEEIKAKVIGVKEFKEITDEESEKTKKIQNVTVRVLEGEYENEEYELEYIITEDIKSITSNVELKEDDNILVIIEEKDGEVTNIIYIETVDANYIMYIVGAILIIILVIISRKRATLIYLLTIILSGAIVIFSLQSGWNLVVVSSIISSIITMILFISINGLNKETMVMIIKAILGIAVSVVLIYALFDLMNLESVNIKVKDKLVGIKDIIVSFTILFSCGIYNAIAISAQYIFYATNKPYKKKSDNIIEGQRSLKL